MRLVQLLTLIPCVAMAEVSVVDAPPAAVRNSHYLSNRAPLLPSPFAKLPIGAIKPEGWLLKQLELQAAGLSGRLDEISVYCKKEGNAWLSKDGQTGYWEEVPYWLKGFGDLGYVLNDPRIQKETQEWIEAVLASQRADGWFGPLTNLTSPNNKTSMEGENVLGRPDLWPNALMMSVLRSNYERTRDPRVLQCMLRYCDWLIALPEKDYLIHWVDKRRGVELLKNILWVYNVTGEERLLDLARKNHRRTNDWTSGISRYHNVDFAECFYEPGLFYTLSHNPDDLAAVERNRALVYDEYGQVPGGMFGGDEKMRPGFTGPRQAVETCGMVEMMHSCALLLTQVEGQVRWADRSEDVAFNSYPAALTAKMDAVRYLIAPNMPVADRISKRPDIDNASPMYNFNPHSHRCCQHNHAHGWPYFAEYLWLATPDNGLCAMFYSASGVKARVADGREVSIRQETRYPFSGAIRLELTTGGTVAFPLYLRVPGWCAAPVVKVNGTAVPVTSAAGRYIRIARDWKDGDVVDLDLPMQIEVQTWKKNKDSVSVTRGPLTYSLRIGERIVESDGRDTIRQSKNYSPTADFAAWPAYELFPATPWNYGLMPEQGFELVEKPWPENNMPWTQEGAPIMLKAKARLIPGWQLQENNMPGEVQQSPVRSREPVETVELLPMGACRLRISAFPTIGTGPKARVWAGTSPALETADKTKEGWQVIVSHQSEKESFKALFDGQLPRSSRDDSIPRLTFGPHQGTEEFISVEFGQERTVKGIEIYWYDDAVSHGGYRVPAAAELYYFRDDEWIPAKPAANVPVAKDRMNRLEIAPVSTTAIEMKIKLQENHSAGVLEIVIL